MYPCPECGWPKVDKEDPACQLCMAAQEVAILIAEDEDKEVNKENGV